MSHRAAPARGPSFRVAAFALLAATAIALAPGAGDAQIYRWKDENGRWQFSDRPPPDGAERVGKERKGAAAASADLAAELESKIGPRSKVERASMAVVHIKTPLGQGSGFFVTADGYLLTNQHVVRPRSTSEWDRTEAKLDEARAQIEKAERQFASQRRWLEAREAELKDYNAAIAAEKSGSRRRDMRRQYDAAREQYKDRKREFREAKQTFDEQRRKFQKESLEFSRKSNAATVATNFQITLKDGRKLTARLVGLGRGQDIALLKLDGYKTPHLEAGSSGSVVQGSRVYAIGSPLGLQDSVSEGVVASIKRETLLTDAKILPGNSGGPLISADGEVLGINTAKIAQSASAEGIGLAIRIDVALEQFARELGR